MLSRRRENALGRFIRTEWPKQYWRIFLLGLVAYIVVAEVLLLTQNLHMVPLELLLASALVPAVFVIFCFEQNAFVDMPFGVVSITFMSGAILGLTIAAILEPLLLPPTLTSSSTITLGAALLIALCEESAKVVSVLWFLRDKRLRSELDGLILGAAAGMGFAALETAGYGFVAFLTGFADSLSSNPSTVIAIDAGLNQMNHSLILRMALAVFGHGVWTAIVCAAIWRDRGQSTFRLTFGVILAFSIAVTTSRALGLGSAVSVSFQLHRPAYSRSRRAWLVCPGWRDRFAGTEFLPPRSSKSRQAGANFATTSTPAPGAPCRHLAAISRQTGTTALGSTGRDPIPDALLPPLPAHVFAGSPDLRPLPGAAGLGRPATVEPLGSPCDLPVAARRRLAAGWLQDCR